MDRDNIYETLTSLGYKLSDRGSYWQTNALYRNGDNRTALQIYKDTGIWKDYVEQTPYMPFEKLLKITLNTDDDNEIKNYIKDDFPLRVVQSKQKIEMEKIYSEDVLSKLLPHYKFYNDKGIDDQTLKLFKGGLATNGNMFQRFVFPIYNLNNQIHGFSGRDMVNSKNRPKWKHMGVKSKWLFPNHLSSDSIKKKNEVILVESIGDVLNLFQNGYKNVLCTFGLEISPSLISYLIGLNPQKIIISFNDDSKSSFNSGKFGALKNFFKLQGFFDNSKLYTHLPSLNDFGDMSSNDINDWYNSFLSIEKEDHDINIIKEFEIFLEATPIKSSKKIEQTFKKFKKTYE
jgi:hypothetical protein